MEFLSRCLLLPIDGTEESLRPIEFLSSLYPDPSRLSLILSYFIPPLPPIYQERIRSKEMEKRKHETLASREQDTRAVLDRARKALLSAGFSEKNMQEHVEEKGLAVAHRACRLADIMKVDAVIVQRRTSSGLEGFLRSDPAPALLRHCTVSPVWITCGNIDPSRAVVCISNEATSLRAADHAGFMLSETAAQIDILYVAQSLTSSITSPAVDESFEFTRWLLTPEGAQMRPFLTEACLAMEKAGTVRERIRMTILPGKGNVAQDILAYCEAQGIGIAVVGHSKPLGGWGFLQSSVTKGILRDFRNMALWVFQ